MSRATTAAAASERVDAAACACFAACFSACLGCGYCARRVAEDIRSVGYVSNRASTALSSIEFGLSC